MKIPRANTQKDVNKTVWECIQKNISTLNNFQALDNPCGQGEWLRFLQSQIPDSKLAGIDLFGPNKISENIACHKSDSSKPWSHLVTNKLNLVTCISGAMAFDNLGSYFEQAYDLLLPNGLFIITNDNTWTVRDRLSLLFYGRSRRFKLNYNSDEGNWNNVPLPVLVHSLQKKGFEIVDIKYTAFYTEDYFLLPLAFILWPIQWLYREFEKSNMPKSLRKKLYPFSALLGRHYVIVAKK